MTKDIEIVNVILKFSILAYVKMYNVSMYFSLTNYFDQSTNLLKITGGRKRKNRGKNELHRTGIETKNPTRNLVTCKMNIRL